MNLRAILACALFDLVSCSPTLSGHLTNTSGEPITSSEGRVNITNLSVHNTEDPQIVAATIDSSGRYVADADLAPGEYLVEALVPGYSMASQKVHLGGSATADFTLKPLGSDPHAKPKSMRAGSSAGEGRGAGGATLTPPSL